MPRVVARTGLVFSFLLAGCGSHAPIGDSALTARSADSGAAYVRDLADNLPSDFLQDVGGRMALGYLHEQGCKTAIAPSALTVEQEGRFIVARVPGSVVEQCGLAGDRVRIDSQSGRIDFLPS